MSRKITILKFEECLISHIFIVFNLSSFSQYFEAEFSRTNKHRKILLSARRIAIMLTATAIRTGGEWSICDDKCNVTVGRNKGVAVVVVARGGVLRWIDFRPIGPCKRRFYAPPYRRLDFTAVKVLRSPVTVKPAPDDIKRVVIEITFNCTVSRITPGHFDPDGETRGDRRGWTSRILTTAWEVVTPDIADNDIRVPFPSRKIRRVRLTIHAVSRRRLSRAPSSLVTSRVVKVSNGTLIKQMLGERICIISEITGMLNQIFLFQARTPPTSRGLIADSYWLSKHFRGGE